MFRAPKRDDGAEPVELLEFGDEAGAADVAERAVRRPASGGRKWWAMSAAVVVIVAAFVFGDRDGSPGSAKAPATPAGRTAASPPASPPDASSPATADAQPGPTALTDSPLTGARSSAAVEVSPVEAAGVSFGPIYPNTKSFGLFVSDLASGMGSARIDLDTGVVTSPARGENSGSGSGLAVTGSGTDARVLTTADVNGYFVVQSADGTFWTIGGPDGEAGSSATPTAALRHLRILPTGTSQIIQTIDITRMRSAVGLNGLGTTGDDRPVIVGPDGRGYVLDPASAAFNALTDGRLVTSQPGGYADVVCRATATCGLLLHGVSQSPLTLQNESDLQVSFSPNGESALLTTMTGTGAAATGVVRFADLRTGEVTDIFGAQPPRTFTFGFGTRPWAVWSPDSAVAVFIDGTNLERIDAATRTATILPLPEASVIRGNWTVLAIA